MRRSYVKLALVAVVVVLAGCTQHQCDKWGCWDPGMTATERKDVCRTIEQQRAKLLTKESRK